MIAMNAFKREPAELLARQLAAVERVLRSGWYVLGPEVAAFEAEWARACGMNHAVGVANGLDALEIGLRVQGIGPGDEVITTPMTAFATVLAIMRAGATPVLADIDPATGLLDPESVERCVGPRTRAVLLVHLYGQVRGMERWVELCERHGIFLLEDCAQSHLAAWHGKPAGRWGAWAAYSFYPTKNLGAIGDAGAFVTDDATQAGLARRLRNYGQSERYHHPELGMNSRLDELQAALLTERLAELPAWTARRCAVATAYRAGSRNPQVELLAAPAEPDSHVHHLFVVRTPERDRLSAHLKSHQIESLCHYPVPVHFQPPCRSCARDPRGLPNAELHAAQCLSIPCHPYLDDADLASVIAAVNAFK